MIVKFPLSFNLTSSSISLLHPEESNKLTISVFQNMSRASKEIYAESVNVSAKRPRQKRKSGRKDDETFNPNMDEAGNIRRNVEEKKVVCHGSIHERGEERMKLIYYDVMMLSVFGGKATLALPPA